MTVGKRIKELRNMLKLTQKEFSDKINVSPQVVSNWEREYTKPNSEDVSRIAKALDVSTEYLYGRSDEPSPVITNKEHELDDEYRKIERFARKVSSKDREKALNLLKVAFEDAFNEDDQEDDDDDI